jgi:environmental stress-induced protein Ves
MIIQKRFFAVQLIRYSDQAVSAWKNGGGITREIGKLHPPNESSYLWRASNADVTTSGPFSDFTGYDRILLLLSGSGLKLTMPTNITWTLQIPVIEQV